MIYIIVIETNFKTKNSIQIFFIKKLINQIRFFFPKEHVRTLISKEVTNITHFLLLETISAICVIKNITHFLLLETISAICVILHYE